MFPDEDVAQSGPIVHLRASASACRFLSPSGLSAARVPSFNKLRSLNVTQGLENQYVFGTSALGGAAIALSMRFRTSGSENLWVGLYCVFLSEPLYISTGGAVRIQDKCAASGKDLSPPKISCNDYLSESENHPIPTTQFWFAAHIRQRSRRLLRSLCLWHP